MNINHDLELCLQKVIKKINEQGGNAHYLDMKDNINDGYFLKLNN